MEPLAEKLILVTGLTGATLDRFLEAAYSAAVSAGVEPCRAKFEDELRSLFGWEDIERIAYQLYTGSRGEVLSRFLSAVESIKSRCRGAEALVVAAHLSYFTSNTIVLNPAINEILGLGMRARIIYVVEDYYDALRRIAERGLRRPGKPVKRPFKIDPLFYLSWRGFEHSLLLNIKTGRGGVDVKILGAKHPRPTLEKLVIDFLEGGYVHVYASHPIRLYRRLASRLGVPLGGLAEVRAVERVKRAASRDGWRIILYDPASVDELILEEDGGCEAPALHVSPRNRWPVTRETVVDDYPYLKGGSVDVARVASLVSPGFGESVRAESSRGCSERYLLDRLRTLIEAQVEQRDYSYVEQSHILLAIQPFYYTFDPEEPALHLVIHESRGMYAEVMRARCLGRRIVAVALGLPLDKAAAEACHGRASCVEDFRREVMSLRLPSARDQLDPSYVTRGCLESASKEGIEEASGCSEGEREYLFNTVRKVVVESFEREGPFGALQAAGTLLIALSERDLDALPGILAEPRLGEESESS